VQVAARVVGSGPAVVLVHNAGNDHHNWDPQIAALSADRTVVALDLAGFGASRAPATDPTLALYAEQLLAVLDGLDLEQADVVGHCVGGAAAWRLALDQRDRVRSLALMSPATLHTMQAGPYGALYRLARSSGAGDRLATALARTIVALGPTRRAAIRVQLGAGDAPPDFVRHCEALYARPDNLAALRALLLHFDSFASLDTAGHPGCPTLLLWGTANRILPFGASPPVRERLQPDHDVVLHGAGHLVMQERPAAISELLWRWLAHSSAASSSGRAHGKKAW
jgi:pimeloyl-ACP methyl ester carboxylesterase